VLLSSDAQEARGAGLPATTALFLVCEDGTALQQPLAPPWLGDIRGRADEHCIAYLHGPPTGSSFDWVMPTVISTCTVQVDGSTSL
jgi:hypothetical protein